MEYIISLLLLFVSGSFLLKASFYPLWGKVAVAIASALFVGLVTPWITELPSTWMPRFLTSRPLLLNLSVCITVEAAVMIGFCFSRIPPSFRKDALSVRIGKALLLCYPGLLMGGVWCFLISKILYVVPGMDFRTLPWMASGVVLLAVGGGAETVKRLFPEQSLRLELLFLVNLFIIILNIIVTGY